MASEQTSVKRSKNSEPKNKNMGTQPGQKEPVSRETHEAAEKKEQLAEVTRESEPQIDAKAKEVYREVLEILNQSGIQYAVGAAFARNIYTGIWRYTKDLDVFLRPVDLKTAMMLLNEGGFDTEIRAKHWLAKAWKDDYFIDLIFGTGHGQVPIDEDSFEGSLLANVLGVKARLIPIEEMIASSAYVAGRKRFDGPEIVHLIHGVKGKLDWDRILRRLGNDRELLLWHLILFDFVYPGHSNYLPKDIMDELFQELKQRWEKRSTKLKAFRGTLLDPFSFVVDVEDWGYEDRREISPLVNRKGEAL